MAAINSSTTSYLHIFHTYQQQAAEEHHANPNCDVERSVDIHSGVTYHFTA